MDEKDFYTERSEQKPAQLHCPFCRQSDTYPLRWIVRTKRSSLPPRASSEDRAKFAKARSYMVRADDAVHCQSPRCRKRFEVSGVQSVVLL
ncbi:MAG TPA: hypothetical protein VGR67_15050 [Candidatus Polarisedimenticolia bacterium]|jgi:hypothetical protein|nr:hypothetical protein [Candidatus Polarisedimenticolia bacterium]